MDNKYLDTSYGRVVTVKTDTMKNRQNKLLSVARKYSASLIFISHPDLGGYRAYLTGTANLDRFSTGGIILSADGTVFLIRDDLYFDSPIDSYKEKEYNKPYNFIETNGFCATRLKKLNADSKQICIIHFDDMRLSTYQYFKNEIGINQFVDITLEADLAKAVKDSDELSLIVAQNKCINLVFNKIPNLLYDGVTDWNLYSNIRHLFYEYGSYGNDNGLYSEIQIKTAQTACSFSEYNLSYPGIPIRTGSRIDIRACCVGVDSVYAFKCRSFLFNSRHDYETEKMWNVSVLAQKVLADDLFAGYSIEIATEHATKIVEEKGYLIANRNSMVFGIGYSMHERPLLQDKSSEWKMLPGMTLVITPEIRNNRGDTVCCGDVFVVQENGIFQIQVEDNCIIKTDKKDLSNEN